MPENPQLQQISFRLGRITGKTLEEGKLEASIAIAEALIEIAASLYHIDKTNLNVELSR